MDAFVIAGSLNIMAALLHVAVIIGGAPWYRFFGAGEAMAAMAEQGSVKPTIITSFIALVLFVWGLYAFSAAGLILQLPLIKWALLGITGVYLLRGAAGLIAPFIKVPALANIIQENSTSFWVVSSLVCLGIGSVHLCGLIDKWTML